MNARWNFRIENKLISPINKDFYRTLGSYQPSPIWKRDLSENESFYQKYLFIKYNAIIFQSWWLESYSFLSQEHCKLITFDLTSIFFKPLSSNVLHDVLWLILGLEEFHINDFKRQLKYDWHIINTKDLQPILGNWNVWSTMKWKKYFTLIFL